MYSASSSAASARRPRAAARDRSRPRSRRGMIYDLDGDLVIGRGERPRSGSRTRLPPLVMRASRTGQHRHRRRSRLDQRHLPQRGAAGNARAAAPGRPGADRRQRVHVRGRLACCEWLSSTPAPTPGRQRRANEDSLLARPPLFVVADGMGGAQAGEVASQIAVESFREGLARLTRSASWPSYARGQHAHPRALACERRAGRHGHDAHGRVRRRARRS